MIDGVVVEDRGKVIDLWMRTQRHGAAEWEGAPARRPSRWMTLHFLDLRADHGVLMCVLIPGEEVARATTAPSRRWDAPRRASAP